MPDYFFEDLMKKLIGKVINEKNRMQLIHCKCIFDAIND